MTTPTPSEPGIELPDGDDAWKRREGDWRIITGELSHSCRDAFVGWKGSEIVTGLLNELPRGGWLRATAPAADQPTATIELADPATCQHEGFACEVDVDRLEDIGRFQANVRIKCDQCGKKFRFIGLPAGLDLNGAAVSADASEARLAIAPHGEVVSMIEGGPVGFSIRKGQVNG